MSKLTRLVIGSKLMDLNKKKGVRENMFLHLYTAFGLKNQNTNGQKSLLNWHLTAHQTAQR